MRLYFLILDNESGEVIVDWFHKRSVIWQKTIDKAVVPIIAIKQPIPLSIPITRVESRNLV